MTKIYHSIFKFFFLISGYFFFPGFKYHFVFSYFIYNPIVIVLLLIGMQINLSISSYLFISVASAMVILALDLFGFQKLGLFLFAKWYLTRGHKLRFEASGNMRFKSKFYKNSFFVDLYNDDIRYNQNVIKNYDDPRVKANYLGDIELKTRELKEIKKSKCNIIDLKGYFIFERNSSNYLLIHEVTESSLFSLSLLCLYFITGLNNSSNIFWIISWTLILSVGYSFFILCILKFQSLEMQLDYDPKILANFNSSEKKYFEKYLGQKMLFSEMTFSNLFYRKYIIFFQIKNLIAALISTQYFVLLSFIFVFFVRFDLIQEFVVFWCKFYTIFILFWISIYFILSSFLVSSTLKIVIVNFIFTSILSIFIAFYRSNGDLQAIVDRIWEVIAFASLFTILNSFLVASWRKIFLSSESSTIFIIKGDE